jgi:hypothetical protein
MRNPNTNASVVIDTTRQSVFRIPTVRHLGLVRLCMFSAEGEHPDELVAEFDFTAGRALIILNPACTPDCSLAKPWSTRGELTAGATALRMQINRSLPDDLHGTFDLSWKDGPLRANGPFHKVPFVEVWQKSPGRQAEKHYPHGR